MYSTYLINTVPQPSKKYIYTYIYIYSLWSYWDNSHLQEWLPPVTPPLASIPLIYSSWFCQYELQSQEISLSIWKQFKEGPGVSNTATDRGVWEWSFLQTDIEETSHLSVSEAWKQWRLPKNSIKSQRSMWVPFPAQYCLFSVIISHLITQLHAASTMQLQEQMRKRYILKSDSSIPLFHVRFWYCNLDYLLIQTQ